MAAPSPRNLPVGSAVRAASAARAAASPRNNSLGPRPGPPASPRNNSLGPRPSPQASARGQSRGRSSDHRGVDGVEEFNISQPGSARSVCSRPGSADVARRAMGGDPRIVMSPLHPRHKARGDGSLGPPNPQEKELLEVCQAVAELAPQKFTSVREAFRYLRPDHNGKISRSQVQYFFRAYGVERVQSDRLFGYFEPGENDDIDGQQFIDFFREHINPEEDAGEIVNASSRPPTPGSRRPSTPMNFHVADAADPLVAKLTNEFHYMLQEVREKAPQRFSHVREALRIVDGDYDGCITRGEMQHFFRCFGVDEQRADKFFERLAAGGPGGANYHVFVQIVAPFLDLPGAEAVKNIPARPQSRPMSARSRPSSADSRRPSSARDRQETPRAASRKEVLESALSSCGSQCLPGLPDNKGALESPSSARRSHANKDSKGRESLFTPASQRGSRKDICESPRSARGRPSLQQSPRRSSKELSQGPRERSSSVCNSPRPSVSAHGESHASAKPALVNLELLRQPLQPKENPHLDHQLKLGNFAPLAPMKQDPFQDRGVAYKPAPPPSGGRQGRRPMGIAARKADNLTQAKDLQPELITNWANDEALVTGGRPVASPFRRPATPILVQCE